MRGWVAEMGGSMIARAVIIDASSLNAAIAMARGVTTQEPTNLVLNAGRGVALKAKKYTPFVEQDRIDSDMGVISTPQLAKRGPRKGLPLKSGKQAYEIPAGSMAVKIVLARLTPGSPFNQRTHNRWALDRATFSPGMGEAGFWERVAETARNMVAARHSSTHFLQAGWAAVYRKLTQLRAGRRALLQDEVIDVEATVIGSEEFGDAKLGGGGTSTSLVLENMIGGVGVNAESYNEALHKHSGPALQRAVEEQSQEMQERYLPRWEEKLAREWNSIP